jgi:ribonuclease P protein component
VCSVQQTGGIGLGITRTAAMGAAEPTIRLLLGLPPSAKTPHFSLHMARPDPLVKDLPTEFAPQGTRIVDNNASPNRQELLLVVPKRHARRAVTRNLLRRQMREAARRHGSACPSGPMLLRLRQGFGKLYPSAASTALRLAAREELERLFAQVGR